MIDFIKPKLLGTKGNEIECISKMYLEEFKNRFADPINNGAFKDSSRDVIKLAKRRTFVLQEMVDFVNSYWYITFEA